MNIKELLNKKISGKNYNAFRVKHLIASMLGVLFSIYVIGFFR